MSGSGDGTDVHLVFYTCLSPFNTINNTCSAPGGVEIKLDEFVAAAKEGPGKKVLMTLWFDLAVVNPSHMMLSQTQAQLRVYSTIRV